MIGRSLATLGILVLLGPAALQAQVGLASGAASIALIARVPPRASIDGVSAARKPARRGNLREETVRVRLSVNTPYRLMVLGTAPANAEATNAATLWVRAESGRFEEVRPGVAVTIVRGRHAATEREPEVTFRSYGTDSVETTRCIPVRYELRIDPTI